MRPWAAWSVTAYPSSARFVVRVQEAPVGPAALPGIRVGVQCPADEQPVAGDGVDAQQVAVGQGPAGFPGLQRMVVAGAHDQVPGAGRGAVGDAHGRSGPDDAEADQVIADAAGQFPAQRVVGGHQQRVGAVHGERDVGGRGGIHHPFRITALDPAVLVILGQHRSVTGAQPQAGSLLPAGAEPDRLGELDVAEPVGEQGHAAAVFHRLQLGGVPGQDHLAACCFGEADQVGQLRAADHRRLVDRQQGARADRDWAAGAALAGQVAEELSGVVRHRDAGRQGVAGGLRRRDADHRAKPRRFPGPCQLE